MVFGARDEDYDVEFGFEGRNEFVAGFEFFVESEGGVSSLLEVLSEFTVVSERQ